MGKDPIRKCERRGFAAYFGAFVYCTSDEPFLLFLASSEKQSLEHDVSDGGGEVIYYFSFYVIIA